MTWARLPDHLLTHTSLPGRLTTPTSSTPKHRRAARVLNALHRWAESGWGATATFAWAIAQGSFVPGPSEGLLIPLGVADPPRAFRLALTAAAGATIGGAIGYVLGAGFIDAARQLLEWAGVSAAELELQRSRFDRWGWWLIFASTMSPLSTKIVCIAAGALGYPFPVFLGALALGRTIRFLGVALLLRWFGPRIAGWVAGGRPIRSSG